jgi:hypothetical protein
MLIGCHDKKEDTVIDTQYDEIVKYSDNLLLGTISNDFYIMDENGMLYDENPFDFFRYDGNNRFVVSRDEVGYLIEIVDGELIINYKEWSIIAFGKETMIINSATDNIFEKDPLRDLLVDKTIEFLTALTEDYNKTMDATLICEGQRVFMEPVFKNKTISGVYQIGIVEGSYNLEYACGCDAEAEFTLMPYVMFDGFESKAEFYVGFMKAENGEYMVCGFTHP